MPTIPMPGPRPRVPCPAGGWRGAVARAGSRRRAVARAGLGVMALAVAAALAGCAQRADASPLIELGTAYVGQAQGTSPTDAYLVIRNDGTADRLVSASSSAGGTVTLVGPESANPDVMRAVTAVGIPGHTLIRLTPNSYHLMISDSRPMKSGTEITLTLRFARAGSFQVAAEVTNPQTGGSSYFLN
jgi:copper(I)-binding protein